MKNILKSGGFTLIELLVVVLIIGILSAIALPQYENAVEKSRVSEALLNMNSMQKAVELHVLQNDKCDGELVGAHGAANKLDIDLETDFDCTVSGGDFCASKDFAYDVYGGSYDCHIRAYRTKSSANHHNDVWNYYGLGWDYNIASRKWTKHCNVYNNSKEGNLICKSLISSGGWDDGSM